MKSKAENIERAKLRHAIDDDLITSSFDFDPHNLPDIRISVGREQDFLDALVKLHSIGCNPVTLSWALRLGISVRGKTLPSVPPTEKILSVLKRLESLADEINALERCGFLLVINREETLKLWKEKQLGWEEIDDLGEVLPHLDLTRWMKRKADMYRRWLKLASLRIPPKSGTLLTRLDYLFPALYVKEATGKLNLPLLLDLFDTIGIQVDEGQLSREFGVLIKDYKYLLMTMRSMLCIVKDRTIA